VEPGRITRLDDAVRRAQSKQFAVPNAIPSSVFTPDSQHHENPSSPEPTTHHSHPLAAAPAMPVFTAIKAAVLPAPGAGPAFATVMAAVEAGLDEERRSRLSSWQKLVSMPLSRIGGPRVTIPLIMDGLDQPEPGARELIIAALHRLTTDPELALCE
jgi:hypothetical protein